jgi:hypothetical protein
MDLHFKLMKPFKKYIYIFFLFTQIALGWPPEGNSTVNDEPSYETFTRPADLGFHQLYSALLQSVL